MKLETSHPRICRFYSDHPTIDFESVNLYVIDLFEKINVQSLLDNQVLLQSFQNHQQLDYIKNSLSELKNDLSVFNQDITNHLLMRLMEMKKEYISDIKNIIHNNTFDKISPLIEKNNHILIDKTNLLLNEILPKGQQHEFKQIHNDLYSFHKSIKEDTHHLVKHMNHENLKEFHDQLELKFNQMVQQPIGTLLHNIEERDMNQQHYQKTLIDKFDCLLTKMNHGNYNKHGHDPEVGVGLGVSNSSYHHNQMNGGSSSISSSSSSSINNSHESFKKNNIISSDERVYIILNQLYNTSDIVPIKNISNYESSQGKESFDHDSPHQIHPFKTPAHSSLFMMTRMNKPKILIESMDTVQNIHQDQMNDFIKTMKSHKSHGVFLSQNSGFTFKPNYHIEIHYGFVSVFVHKVEYQAEKIAIAIDIIDHLSSKLKDCDHPTNGMNFNIDKDTLEEINHEYKSFLLQKESLLNHVKENHKKTVSQIEEMNIPSLSKYLSTKFESSAKNEKFKCVLCNNYNAINLKALAAHRRGCERKKNKINQLKNSGKESSSSKSGGFQSYKGDNKENVEVY